MRSGFIPAWHPQDEYANRFIEQPLIKTRLLHWINFRFGATGYLHWGWDFWSDNCLEETAGIIPEAGNIMPGGDAFITYPGNGKILSSIRLEAMRDGIVDYELLKMLEQRVLDQFRKLTRRSEQRQLLRAVDRSKLRRAPPDGYQTRQHYPAHLSIPPIAVR